jgi:pseudo-response regulator 5
VLPIFCSQSGPSQTPTPSSVSQPDPTFQNNSFYQNTFHQFGQNTNNSTYQKQDHVLDSVDDRGHISPTTDQSTSSGFCNGVINRLNSLGYGSACGSNNGNGDQLVIGNSTAAESKNEEGYFTTNTNSNKSSQREAALNKFRMKRKDRCYEKKVRYESRKKLAEQRPRVKGQFVRQVPIENGGSSFDS